MKLKLTSPCVVQGHPGIVCGDVFEETGMRAMYLLSLGVCVEVADNEIQTREPEIESRDPELKPVKRSKRTLP